MGYRRRVHGELKASNSVNYYLQPESMKALLSLTIVATTATAFPQSKSGCGRNERGVLRKPGDIWDEQCNQCRCLNSGVPGCTRKFCESNPGSGQGRSCKDSEGKKRKEGALWQDVKSNNVCACRTGVVLCGSLQPVTTEKNLRTETSDVSFPIKSKVEATCKDANGNTRNLGDSWKEDCNTCGCAFAGRVCTEKLCLIN